MHQHGTGSAVEQNRLISWCQKISRKERTKEEKERILWTRCTLQGCVPCHLIFPNRPLFLLSTTSLASNHSVKLSTHPLTNVSIRSEISWTGHFPNPHLWIFIGPSLWETISHSNHDYPDGLSRYQIFSLLSCSATGTSSCSASNVLCQAAPLCPYSLLGVQAIITSLYVLSNIFSITQVLFRDWFYFQRLLLPHCLES